LRPLTHDIANIGHILYIEHHKAHRSQLTETRG